MSEKSSNQIPVQNLDENDLPNISRRRFFKRTALAGAGVMAAGAASLAASKASIQGQPSAGVQTIPEFKPKDQRDVVLTYAASPKLNKEVYPERNEQYSRLNKKDFNFNRDVQTFEHKVPYDNDREGYTQMDKALMHASWFPLMVSKSRAQAFAQPNTPMHAWDQSDVHDDKYDFGSHKRAATVMKSAARLFGAVRCGITRFDKRFVYDPMYDIVNEQELTWENDFPFEPKSVIVLMTPMDYDNVAAAPAWTVEGATGNGYVDMSKMACQMAKFIRGMGYNAVGAGNDLGNSVAMAIQAGLGEGGRNGSCLAPGVGPRVRICKIFTNIDFGDAYDVPHTWGITEFCKSCGKCAESCPADAIPYPEEKNGGYGFEPTYEFSDEPGYTWNNHVGIKKFYSDAKRCFNFWIDNDSSCGNCIASCTFNEPDFWHHWFIMAINPAMPSFIHGAMAEAHPAFGYGGQSGTPVPGKPEKFWQTGEGMRVNDSMRNNIGAVGKA
jgi:reductive dehalogenase